MKIMLEWCSVFFYLVVGLTTGTDQQHPKPPKDAWSLILMNCFAWVSLSSLPSTLLYMKKKEKKSVNTSFSKQRVWQTDSELRQKYWQKCLQAILLSCPGLDLAKQHMLGAVVEMKEVCVCVCSAGKKKPSACRSCNPDTITDEMLSFESCIYICGINVSGCGIQLKVNSHNERSTTFLLLSKVQNKRHMRHLGLEQDKPFLLFFKWNEQIVLVKGSSICSSKFVTFVCTFYMDSKADLNIL